MAPDGTGRDVHRHRRYDVVFYIPWIGSLIAPGSGPPAGGAETQILLVARALARLGARVCVVAYDHDGSLPATFEGFDVRGRPPPRWRSIPGLRGKLAEVASVFRAVLPVDAALYVQRGTSMETGLVALAAKLKRRRFAYSSANTIDFTWGEVADRKNALLFELGVRLADRVVVQTSEQVALCRQHWGIEPVLVRSIAEPAPRQARPGDAFLWIGKYAHYKRPREFVELARAVPEARFRLVGVRTEKDSEGVAADVERAASGLPNLELLEERPRAEVMSLVERAVAVVSTSDYEGMPNVFLEAWARGVPTLTLAHDPDGIVERERIGGVAHGSTERLAELVRAAWREREDRTELADRCRSYVEREHGAETVAGRWRAHVMRA